MSSNSQTAKMILDATTMGHLVSSIAGSILAEFKANRLSNLALLGIQLKGVPLAMRIRNFIKTKKGISVPFGKIDISMYRDDIGTGRKISKTYETDIPFDIEEKIIILVDDVLHSGRTIRAALDAITDYGRPALIRLAVLIDRQTREFPIGADYAGISKRFPADKKITVHWKELGEKDSVWLYPIENKVV